MSYLTLVDTSVAGDEDYRATEALVDYLRKADVFESLAGEQRRSRILERLGEIVDEWSRRICTPIVCSF